MKTIRLILAIGFITGLAFSETTNAFEIISYSPDTGIVTINSGIEKTNRPFRSFTADEQQQITDWLTDKKFNALGIRVEIEKKKTTTNHGEYAPGGQTTLCGKKDRISYVITLKNQTAVPFENVEINYRIFYKTQDESRKAKRSIANSMRIDLQPEETRSIETQDVDIRDEQIVTPGFSITGTLANEGIDDGWAPTKFMKDRLGGLYLCVSKQGRNGHMIRLEFEDGDVPEEAKRASYN